MANLAMQVVVCVCLFFIGMTYCYDRSVTIDRSSCDSTYTLSDDDDVINLYYYGASLERTCKITIKTSDGLKDICAFPKRFDLNSCAASIQYHTSYYSSFSPDEDYTCTSKQYTEYCTSYSTLIVAVEKDGTASFAKSDNVHIKITRKDNGISGLVDASVTAVYVIVGVVVGVVVLLIIVTVVVIICCCKRRSSAGTVYRSPAQAGAVTTTGYPMANQPGYQPGFQQPPPGGYQPPPAGFQQPPPGGYQPPPAGFQQPPPGGYQQQPTGYPATAQQGYAGYQTGPDASYPSKASAPPCDGPPAYS